MNARKIANLAVFSAMFSAREKNLKFFHCVQIFNPSSIGHFVCEHEASSLLCRIALRDCFGVVIVSFIG